MPGCLFSCPDEYLFIFETKHKAKYAANDSEYTSPLSLNQKESQDYANYIIDHYQGTFNERVFYSQPGEILLLVKKGGMHWSQSNKDRTFLKILSGRIAGWIVVKSRQKLVLAGESNE